ncbi:MAG: ABC transporter ATP-binding protein [Oscillospiraceae bacterium]|nr:ABC transporter ATP-binding protein [Oscillospiraceae bacterium]
MISIRSLNKIYLMGENVVKALDDVSVTIAQGEFAAILGTSGSGKSTLMNIIGCLDTRYNSGEYELCGQNVSKLSGRALSLIRNNKIGFIFQGFNLVPTLTARENVELPLIYRKTPTRKRQRLIDDALEIVGLTSRSLHKPSELSGGQQQRVAIARAIASTPDIILADEPCGNLDSKAGQKVMNTLSMLNSEGKTIVLITHDEKATSAANKIIRLSDGRVVS